VGLVLGLSWMLGLACDGADAGASENSTLTPIFHNERAIAFHKKLGFEDTEREHGRHKIPRRMMVRAVRPT